MENRKCCRKIKKLGHEERKMRREEWVFLLLFLFSFFFFFFLKISEALEDIALVEESVKKISRKS